MLRGEGGRRKRTRRRAKEEEGGEMVRGRGREGRRMKEGKRENRMGRRGTDG